MRFDLNEEVIRRIQYMYQNVDGTIDFPNSYDGDVLKIAYQAAHESLKLQESYAHKIEIPKKFAEILDYHFGFGKSGLHCTKSVVDDDEEKLITQNWDLTYAYLNPLTRKFVEVIE